jgi:polyribonucleotide nucleotidyltransferase
MFEITKKSIKWGGRKLTLETGRMARQADGSVLASYGDTVVLCTVVGAKEPRPDIDFFPLTVHYQEKYFASGRIPGGFFKREGRATEKETLTSRLIDRPIRPLFHEDYKNDTQVICTVISYDGENDPDIVALVGTSAALTLSGIPFMGPVGASRVGYIDGEFVLNPLVSELPASSLDLVVAGTESSVLMVESEAKELDEDLMLKAVMFGHKQMQPVLDLIIEMAEAAASEPWNLPGKAYDAKLFKEVEKFIEADLKKAYKITGKQERRNALDEAKSKVMAKFVNEEAGIKGITVGTIFKKLESDIVRGGIISSGKRIDGRKVDEIRQIAVEVGVLPKTHGSALFTRGETQALVVSTLGTGDDEQMIDSLDGESRESFMLHYNFPPYSVGETSPMRAPGRREVGHGKLAWRAIHPMMPTKDEFPYTIRVVSEITESNGSSSMATVCGTSLAMMDAGVPLASSVAGIAMGLIKEDKKFAVLSDIMGDEDHLGDMDFKVAGTRQGITALQMDIKINGITEEIMKVALTQAQAGRIHILNEMEKVIKGSRGEVNENAPRIHTIKIPVEKIREVIGSGGSVIRKIVEESGAKIDIDDDGTVRVGAVQKESLDKALAMIEGIVAEPEVGRIYTGKVVRIVDFGAFVNFMGAKDGLVHISEFADERVESVTDYVQEGDIVKVKLIDVDPRGKVKLSYRAVNQETGEDVSEGQVQKAPSGDRGERGGDRDRGGRGGERRDRGDRGDRGGDDRRDRPRKRA